VFANRRSRRHAHRDPPYQFYPLEQMITVSVLAAMLLILLAAGPISRVIGVPGGGVIDAFF
jgi:hypothetical protein